MAGPTERDGELTFNTTVLIEDGGRLRLKHRKINKLNIAWDICIGSPLGPARRGRQ